MVRMENAGKGRFFGALALFGLVLCISFAAPSVGSAGSNRFVVNLDHGVTEGVKWAATVDGKKFERLGRLCVSAGFVAPPEPGADYVEGDGTELCGSVSKLSDSLLLNMDLGSTESSIFVGIYRPVVRTVKIEFDSGHSEVLRAVVPKATNRRARGIPLFRYVVAEFASEPCIRRITTFNSRGGVIGKKAVSACTG
jgi:hypothetical protein